MKYVLPVLTLALVLPALASAQTLERFRFGIGAGPTILTGTPERPAPAEGESLTGAGGTYGWNLRLIAERKITSSIQAQGQVFWNRLTSDEPTWNCLGSQGQNDTVPCYPAAKVDRALGVTLGARAVVHRLPFKPYVGLAGGAAQYHLTPDNTLTSRELEPVRHLRPVYRLSAGSELAVGRGSLLIEGAFVGSVGRGGGTHHFPLSLTFLW